MPSASRVERVIVVPRNGYANRLQAWASAALLAEDLGAVCEVSWEPQPVATAPASRLFSATELERFVNPPAVTDVLGRTHEKLPRGLLILDDGVAFLAGHERGEQAFMAGLAGLVGAVRTLVVVAGGLFSWDDDARFEQRRRGFYGALGLSSEVEDVLARGSGPGPFIGLHSRGTDRAVTAPTKRALTRALRDLARATGVHATLIAADTAAGRSHWHERALQSGLEPWSLPITDLDRSSSDAGVQALAEWWLLGHAQAIAYARASTFGHEAAIRTAMPAASRGVGAGAVLQTARRARSIALAAGRFRR